MRRRSLWLFNLTLLAYPAFASPILISDLVSPRANEAFYNGTGLLPQFLALASLEGWRAALFSDLGGAGLATLGAWLTENNAPADLLDYTADATSGLPRTLVGRFIQAVRYGGRQSPGWVAAEPSVTLAAVAVIKEVLGIDDSQAAAVYSAAWQAQVSRLQQQQDANAAATAANGPRAGLPPLATPAGNGGAANGNRRDYLPDDDPIDLAEVPEADSAILVGLGLVAVGLVGRRRTEQL